ncbi:MAG: hypothetical protein U0L72_03690 [Acutalibacteraceae bacterium]|nr:hypothetical protein [Acutalibacteraceae bacterium]
MNTPEYQAPKHIRAVAEELAAIEKASDIPSYMEETTMKKDMIFAPIMLLIGVLLFLLRATGMTAHIVISVIGVLALIAYTVLTKKEWKIPALEILMRAFYGVALITGIVIMNVHGIVALALMHKVSAVLFLAMLVVLLVSKAASNKKA